MNLEQFNRAARRLDAERLIWKMRRKSHKFQKQNRRLCAPLPKTIEKAHKKMWSALYSRIDLFYLRLYSNFSGQADHRYVPHDLYFSIFERVFNNLNIAINCSNKCHLESFVGWEHSPKTLIRCMAGTFCDQEMNIISRSRAKALFNNFSTDLLVKPSLRSAGGRNIQYLHFKKGNFVDDQSNSISFEDLISRYRSDFLLQRIIKQHSDLAKIHKHSVNTIIVQTYRSVRTEEIHILKAWLVMARSGHFLSNYSSGGICTSIDPQGQLGDFAYDSSYKKYYEHPDSGVEFKNYSIPYIGDLLNLIRRVALNVPSQRLIGFDATIESSGKPVIIEMKFCKVGIEQCIGGPLFGSRTEEIIEDALRMKKMDNLNIIRI